MRLIFIIVLMCWAPAGFAGQIGADALGELPKHDVILLGEVHDNPEHHQNQAIAVKAIRPAALVFEMLTAAQAGNVSPENRLSAEALALALGWEGTGWPDFGLYFPIFAAAPDAVVYGANLPRDQVRRAVKAGAASVFGDDAALYGLNHPLPKDQQDQREAEQRAAHCNALPENLLAGMVESQRLRDASLARAVLTAWQATGGPVVVITGNGHARTDQGVPAMLRLAAPDLTVLSLGQIEGEPDGDAPYDLFLVTEPMPREDPCLAFRDK